MRKSTMIWLIIATSLILIGGVIFTAMLSKNSWDFASLSTANYQTNTYTSRNEIRDISIDTVTADIAFIFTEEDSAKVVCYEMEKAPHTVSFDDGKLLIKEDDQRKWYDHIGIYFDAPTIRIYLPKANLGTLDIKTTTGDISLPSDFQFESIGIRATTGDVTLGASAAAAVNVKTTTGDITVEDTSCKSLTFTATTGRVKLSNVICHSDIYIKVSTGKLELTNVLCENFNSEGTTGDVVMHSLLAANQLDISRTTGDVTFSDCDAKAIDIRLNTGDVTGTLCTGKFFVTETDTGDVILPPITGDGDGDGNCRVYTSTGDIKISISGN